MSSNVNIIADVLNKYIKESLDEGYRGQILQPSDRNIAGYARHILGSSESLMPLLIWRTVSERVTKSGGSLHYEEIRRLYFDGYNGPHVTQNGRDFLAALNILSKPTIELDIERFM